MKTAVMIKDATNHKATAAVYRLSEPVPYDSDAMTEFVYVSAADVPFSGPETYIFACDESGNVLNWSEMDGSYRGGLNHAEALRRAGFTLAEESAVSPA